MPDDPRLTTTLHPGHPDTDACEVLHVHPADVAAAQAAMPHDDTVAGMAEVFKALGDPTRLQILLALRDRELCVCDLASLLGMSQSAVSHQLRILRHLHMVRSERRGKLVYYALADEHVLSLCEQTRAHLSEPHPAAGS